MAKQKRIGARNKKRLSLVQIIILTVIGISVLLTAGAVIIALIDTPENQVTSKVESLASSYYENVIYDSMLNSDKFSGDPAKALGRYSEKGLTPVSLQQLIILNKIMHTDTAEFLLKYCDEESTYVKFYPQEPYAKDSYRAEFHYSCNF